MAWGAWRCFLALFTLLTVLGTRSGAEEMEEIEDYELMRKAIAKGDVVGAALLLDRGVPVDIAIPSERTPLIDAVRENEPELVRLFLARGADPLVQKYGRRSLWEYLHVSPAMEKHQAKTLEILTLLLDAGLPIDACCDSDEGITLLMKACRAGNAILVERLLAEGASITLRNNWRETTALGYLAGGAPFDRKEVLACLSLLLDAGADPRMYRWGKEGEKDIVQGLPGFLQHLAHTGDASAMNLILERYGAGLSPDRDTASVVLAALLPQIHGDVDAVRKAVEGLVAQGAAPDVRDERGRPVAFEAHHTEAVLALLDAGFPVDTVDDSGRNLLVYFFNFRQEAFREESFIRELVRKGVSVNLPDKDGDTVLFHARTGAQLSCLLLLGADPFWRNGKGSTALHHMIYCDEAAAALGVLLDAADALDVQGKENTVVPALIDAKDTDGNTPFLLAVDKGAVETALYLAGRGADISLRNGADKGALDLLVACVIEDIERSGYLEESALEFVHFLLEHGQNPAQAPLGGDAPLVVALRSDVKGERPFTKALVGAVSKDEVVLARRQLGEERRKGFFENLSWYPGRTAMAVALPLVICGLSIGLREGVYAGTPGANWMIPVNAFLGTAGGLFVAGGLAGGLLGKIIFDDKSSSGMAAIGIGVGIAGMAALGAIAAGIAGTIMSFQPGVRTAFAESAFLYYMPSGISLIVSGVIVKSVFN